MSEIPKKEDVDAAIAPMALHASELLAELPTYKINTAKQARHAGKVLNETKRMIAELEEERTSVTKPLLAVKRKVDSWFTPTVKQLKQGEASLKARINDFLKREAAAQTEALAKGDYSVEEPDLGEAVQARRKTTPELVDFAKVPEEFLLPPEERVDWKKVKAAFNAGAKVPGVKLVVDFTIVGSTK